jgi:hypothetical protein
VKRHDCSSTALETRIIARPYLPCCELSGHWLLWLAVVLLATGVVLQYVPPWGSTPVSAAGNSQEVAQAASSPMPRQPTIQLHHESTDAGKTAFTVAGLDPATLADLAKTELKAEQWTALFAVHVDQGTTDRVNQPAILGSYRVADGVLRFEPRFPLTRGLRYRAVFDPSRLPGRSGASMSPLVAEFVIPKPPATATTVVQQVYPSRDTLPENQLKFYIHFSAPMSRGEAYEHVQLLDAAGKKVDFAFLELGQELWDPQGKRFTLLFDPGRVKRGLKPREDLGPILEAGKRYTFVIDRHWNDAQGNPLKESYRKTFRVGPLDEQPVDPKTWKLRSPRAGQIEPLTVDFPKTLDHAMLGRVLHVTDAQGQTIPGTVTISQEETRWQLSPQQAWRAGRYQLVVETTLEDLAGNNIARPFEVDVFRPIERQVKAETVQIPFQVQAAGSSK